MQLAHFFLKLQISTCYLVFCSLQILTTLCLIIYVALDVHAHHKQNLVLFAELCITMLMILDVVLSLVIQWSVKFFVVSRINLAL